MRRLWTPVHHFKWKKRIRIIWMQMTNESQNNLQWRCWRLNLFGSSISIKFLSEWYKGFDIEFWNFVAIKVSLSNAKWIKMSVYFELFVLFSQKFNLQNKFRSFSNIKSFGCFWAAHIFVHSSHINAIPKSRTYSFPYSGYALTVNALTIIAEMNPIIKDESEKWKYTIIWLTNHDWPT